MEKLQGKNFSVAILPPATAYHPVEGRKYSIVLSGPCSNIHLAIGYQYELNLLNVDQRHEDLFKAEWRPKLGEYMLKGTIYVSEEENDVITVREKCQQYQKMLPEMISFMINADRLFYSHVPWLLDAPIYAEIRSSQRKFKAAQYMGTPRQYINKIKTQAGL